MHFAARGLRAAVPLAGGAAVKADVVAVSTESRGMGAAEIGVAIRAAARIPVGRPRMLFKKIDSTLRGQAGVEIAVALEALGCAAAIVCPAFPGLKRVVRDGWLSVTGAADFAAIDIVAYLRGQGLEASVRSAPAELAAAVVEGARAIVLDAASDADLDEIAAAGLALGGRVLWAGSGGLAAALARTLPGDAARPRGDVAAGGGVLLALGSDHRVTLRQQAELLRARAVDLLDAETADPRCVRAALGDGRHVVLRVPYGRVSAGRLLECVGGAPAGALVLSGGDTASLFCGALGVERIELIGEVVPGVPCGALRGGGFDRMRAATKSGGFGEPDALIQVVDYFTCQKP
ncbi:MAG: hypothetical protein JST11_15765 [Acidobacteria bacterium]|nr:hypothetical protein [Acidobacteriota bacterium]